MDHFHSSDGLWHVGNESKLKGAASMAGPTRETRPADIETCTICLEPITERAVAVPCNHLAFDFICLASWLQERSVCPLCTAPVRSVQYDWRAPYDFKTYHIPAVGHANSRGTTDRARYTGDRPSTERQTVPRRYADDSSAPRIEDPAFERRRQVYRAGRFSLHVGANRISQHHDFTAQEFADSPELQSRARMFLRRELQVFGFLGTVAAPRGGNREFLLEYVVAVLRLNEIKGADGAAEHMLSDYLGMDNAKLLLHELEAWLRSPYTRLSDWDSHVQYAEHGYRQGSKATTLV